MKSSFHLKWLAACSLENALDWWIYSEIHIDNRTTKQSQSWCIGAPCWHESEYQLNYSQVENHDWAAMNPLIWRDHARYHPIKPTNFFQLFYQPWRNPWTQANESGVMSRVAVYLWCRYRFWGWKERRLPAYGWTKVSIRQPFPENDPISIQRHGSHALFSAVYPWYSGYWTGVSVRG